uniref:TRASH domain-containing protein n=1 Tax=Dicentrarchus labrax TaxID=13489 RepID=A0A8C4I846_DICLA
MFIVHYFLALWPGKNVCSWTYFVEVCNVLTEPFFFSDFLSDGGVLNQTEETEDSQEGEVGIWKDRQVTRSEAAPMEDSNPQSPINIKDEPIDEGYDAALLPQSSIRQIKEELEHQEVSVGREILLLSTLVPAALPAPPPAAIFIPGRGAVLQAMAPLPVRPQVPIQSLPALAPVPPRPPQPSVPGSVRCSGCSKVLLKGQTAFQRKGSTQLFCSTVCLTGHLPPANKNRSCFQCNRYVLPRDMITIPADDSTFMHFCGQFCLSVFRHKKKHSDKIPDKRLERKPEKLPEKPHEVTHQGRLHRLCSDACFVTWRKIRQLAMNCCEGCGLYCNSNSGSCQTLTIDRSQLNFCGPTCIGTYKQVCVCMAIVSSTIMERDQKGKVQLYCSSACVEQSRPPRHILTGTEFPCCLCKVLAVPHFDTDIIFPLTTRLQSPIRATITVIPQCPRWCLPIQPCPPLLSQGVQLTLLFDTISYNQQDLVFCSESCKLLFKHDLTSRNKDHPWRPCTYCSGISQKMLHSHYGGRMEEFCRPHCMSQYTVLYYGMGRCDSCRKQGYMTEKLQCLGSVRNFCNLPCLLQYCYLHFETSQHTSSNGTGTAPQTPYGKLCYHLTPTQYDVEYLSCLHAHARALPTSNVDGKNLDHASTQTDAMRVPVSRRRQMKNKSVLCRPFTMDQESMCQLPAPSTESAAGEENVKVLMVPIPVPVFIPVPMNMYSQHTPVPMAMPVPVRPITLHSKFYEFKMMNVICSEYLLQQIKLFSYFLQVPVPMVVPPQNKEMKDAAVQSDSCYSGDLKSDVVTPIVRENEKTQKPVQADLPVTVSSERSTESADPQLNTCEHQPPSSPMMDLETDFPSVCTAFLSIQGRRRTGTVDRSAVMTVVTAVSKLNHLYGVKAWRTWVQQRNKQLRECEPYPVDIKEDVLQCNSAELSLALTRFIREVRRPNGETYSPDSIFYLCLGIQQYLFMKGRIENIFTDELYSQFAAEITRMLRLWRPKLLPSGGVVSSRVVESFLWECKQLGAYSPIVLLNTLLFFCTKNFRFTTLAQHQSLSFTNFSRCSKPCSRAGKAHYLRYQRSSTATPRREDTEEEGDLEMLENVTNPLHCPVRLYEFYLSRCPESVKMRTDMFYLQPEQNVHTHSSHWYTSQPLEGTTLQSMLTRILAVREVHQEQLAAQRQSSATADDDSLQ